jgi:hypothetical protein
MDAFQNFANDRRFRRRAIHTPRALRHGTLNFSAGSDAEWRVLKNRARRLKANVCRSHDLLDTLECACCCRRVTGQRREARQTDSGGHVESFFCY